MVSTRIAAVFVLPGQRPVASFLPAPAQHVPAFPEQDQLRSVFSILSWRNGTKRAAFLYPPEQGSAGGGEAEPAVNGEGATVGEAELPRSERSLELVGQRILAVMVAADGGGLPPHSPCPQQRD